MSGSSAATCSWRALLLLAIGTTLGAVLLAVGLASPDDVSSQGTGFEAGSDDRGETSSRSEPRSSAAPEPARLPVRLEIPAIAVETDLVRLGLTPDRTVQVPSNPDLAGWFHPGPEPGRRGSAVILGHVDSDQGPAVFARLQELRPGDAVTVRRTGGSAVHFVVRRAVLYANADFPALRVYAARGGRLLNLVTCGGAYDSARGGYQSNLVVYTRRVPARPTDLSG